MTAQQNKSMRAKRIFDVVGSFAIGALAAHPVNCQAHARALHVQVSAVAAHSSSGLTTFLSDVLGPANAPYDSRPVLTLNGAGSTSPNNGPIAWIAEGAYHEDDFPRFVNHFYTVTHQVKELTDLTGWQQAALSTQKLDLRNRSVCV